MFGYIDYSRGTFGASNTTPASSSTYGYVEIYNGSSWVLKPIKYWTGSAWVSKPFRWWDGVKWRTFGDGTASAGSYSGSSSPNLSGYTVKNLVTDYGADPTGVADCYTAITNWLGASGSSIALYAPTGAYRCSAHVLMSGKSNRIIYGDGPDKTIFKMTAEGGDVNTETSIVVYQSSNIQVMDFQINAPNTTARAQGAEVNNSRGLEALQCDRVTITNLIANNIPGASILLDTCTNMAVYHCTVKNGWADGVHFTGNGTSNCIAQFCKGINLGDDNFAAIGYTGQALSNIYFLDNESYDCWESSGVHFTGVTNGAACRNKIYRCGVGGIEVTCDSAFSNSGSSYINISNNYIEGAVTRTTTGHSSIMVYTTDDGSINNVTINNNTIVNPASGAGIRAFSISSGTVSGTISNNVLTDASHVMWAPISIESGATFPYIGQGNYYNGTQIAYSLYIDLLNGVYLDTTGSKASLSLLNGYSYSRTGTVGYDTGAHTLTWFADNVIPVISGVGYKSHGSTTNRFLNSQDFTAAQWTVGGATGISYSSPAATITKNVATAPDGTTTAGRFIASSVPAGKDCTIDQNQSNFTYPGYVAGSVWLKSATGVNQNVGVSVQWNTADSQLVTVTPQWQRFFINSNTATYNNHATEGFDFGVMGDPFWTVTSTDRSIDLYVWQGQLLQGDFPDGGPAIATTTSQVSVGASTLSFTVPNGTYSATYTFDDGSTQTISTTISTGTYTVPNYPTLNRPTVTKITLL